MATVLEEIRKLVEQLSHDHQQRVLEFAQELVQAEPMVVIQLPPGIPGNALLRFMLPLEDAEAMERALEDCERIEPVSWIAGLALEQ